MTGLSARTPAPPYNQVEPRQETVTPKVSRAVEVAKAYLMEKTDAPVSLDALSERAGMSKFHLSRKFKASVGVTPSAFSMSLRVNQAKALLRGEPIAHVAVDLGLADQAHLTRTFKCYVGVTPGQYRGASPSYIRENCTTLRPH